MSSKYPSTRPYIVGYFLSLILTLVSFSLTQKRLFNGWALIIILSLLAIVQLMLQLNYFLHLRSETAPRWKNITFLFAVNVVIILVFGTLWIMKNLNYNGGHSENINSTIQKEENIYR